LRYCVTVTINTISLFLDPNLKTIGGRHLEVDTIAAQKRWIRSNNKIFSFPINMLGKEEANIVNEWVKNDEFEYVKKCDNNKAFCKFVSIKGCGPQNMNSRDNVHLEYKRVILNAIMEEIINQATSDSIRFAHIVYNKRFGDVQIRGGIKRKQKFLIINTNRLNIMHWMFSIIGQQVQTVLDETLDYSNVPSATEVERCNPDGVARIGLCLVYENCLDIIRFIVLACESRLHSSIPNLIRINGDKNAY